MKILSIFIAAILMLNLSGCGYSVEKNLSQVNKQVAELQKQVEDLRKAVEISKNQFSAFEEFMRRSSWAARMRAEGREGMPPEGIAAEGMPPGERNELEWLRAENERLRREIEDLRTRTER